MYTLMNLTTHEDESYIRDYTPAILRLCYARVDNPSNQYSLKDPTGHIVPHHEIMRVYETLSMTYAKMA
jgi:hypothetical protein